MIALVLALGGISYAAAKLPKDSVGSKQLKKGAVKSVDVEDQTLEVEDLSNEARDSLRGAKGETGPAGPAGPVARFNSATVAGAGTITTNSILFGPFVDPVGPPGPAVIVDVPASGLVEVYARAHVDGPPNTIAGIGLAVDGAPAPNVSMQRLGWPLDQCEPGREPDLGNGPTRGYGLRDETAGSPAVADARPPTGPTHVQARLYRRDDRGVERTSPSHRRLSRRAAALIMRPLSAAASASSRLANVCHERTSLEADRADMTPNA